VSCDAAFAEIELARCVIICASVEIAHCTEYNTRLNGVPIAGTSRPLLQIRSTTSRAITPAPQHTRQKNGLTCGQRNMQSIYLSITCQMHLPAEIVIFRHYVFDSYHKYFFNHELYQIFDAVIRYSKPRCDYRVPRYRF
jgi:hypothetical protein